MSCNPHFHGLVPFGLVLHFAGGGRGPGFAGAAWRGLLGQALCDAVCPLPTPACGRCPSAAVCAYPTLFKPVPDGALPPVWLHGWRRGRDGWRVGLRWLGSAHHPALGEWLAALARPRRPLEFGGAAVRLDSAAAPDGAPVWSPTAGWLRLPAPLALAAPAPLEGVRVRCLTPLVSKHGGDPLFGALHTRVQRLVAQFGDGTALPRPAQPWDCRVLARKEWRIPLARRALSGVQWELELSAIDPAAWPLLWAGRELHAGGQAGLGCGHYELL